MPGTECQGGQTEFRPLQGLGRTQGFHLAIGHPGPLLPRRLRVENGDIGDAFAFQGKPYRQSGLSRADDHDVLVDPVKRRDPVRRTVAQPVKAVVNSRFQRCQTGTGIRKKRCGHGLLTAIDAETFAAA